MEKDETKEKVFPRQILAYNEEFPTADHPLSVSTVEYLLPEPFALYLRLP